MCLIYGRLPRGIYAQWQLTGQHRCGLCRRLGDLKNGEEKTFLVGESAARVFVIADKLSKNYCNEFYPLPEGEEDVVLTGKNCFNLSAGRLAVSSFCSSICSG